ncbi:MAG: tyrosine-protein phosphatase [Verrucomicrobiota bacterium]
MLRTQYILLVWLLVMRSCFAKEIDDRAAATAKISVARPSDWAQPFPVSGVKNCYQVSSNLFRGAQPTAEGLKNLKVAGIKTVVNLRTFHSDKDEMGETGLKTFHLYTKTWHGEAEDVVAFLKFFSETNHLPVFVHCQRGSDRTGLMCAMYRLAVCGWTKEQAVAEMKNGGFNFYAGWKNLVRLIENTDVADLKRRASLPAK